MKKVFVLIMLLGLPGFAQQTEEMKRRGLTDTNFPRLHKLTENVYAYEMIRAPFQGARFTTDNLIVITSDGVLVADAQGSPEDTTRLIQEINKLTNQPIKYVVIGSEHVDHTGGNAVFPDGNFHRTSGSEAESRSSAQQSQPPEKCAENHRSY